MLQLRSEQRSDTTEGNILTGWIDGSWRQLKGWASRQAATLRDEARLIATRAECLRIAIERSEGIAAGQVLHDLRELRTQAHDPEFCLRSEQRPQDQSW